MTNWFGIFVIRKCLVIYLVTLCDPNTLPHTYIPDMIVKFPYSSFTQVSKMCHPRPKLADLEVVLGAEEVFISDP